MSDKELLQKQYREKNKEIIQIKSAKRHELQERLEIEHQPLLRRAVEVKNKIDSEINNKYRESISIASEEIRRIKDQLDLIKIAESKSESWVAEGTILYEHKLNWTYSSGKTLTGKKGLVCIYDGTQQLSKVNTWREAKKGDVIVMHLKKNGEVGKKYDVITEGGYSNWITAEKAKSLYKNFKE